MIFYFEIVSRDRYVGGVSTGPIHSFLIFYVFLPAGFEVPFSPQNDGPGPMLGAEDNGNSSFCTGS